MQTQTQTDGGILQPTHLPNASSRNWWSWATLYMSVLKSFMQATACCRTRSGTTLGKREKGAHCASLFPSGLVLGLYTSPGHSTTSRLEWHSKGTVAWLANILLNFWWLGNADFICRRKGGVLGLVFCALWFSNIQEGCPVISLRPNCISNCTRCNTEIIQVKVKLATPPPLAHWHWANPFWHWWCNATHLVGYSV